MKKMMFLLLTLLLLGAASAKAQVLISPGTTTPTTGCDLSAVLELRSSNSGLLLPQVKLDTATDISKLTTPVTGMLVCNLTGSLRHGIYYWNGAAWTLYIGF
jgi:P pilus assembly chaperone PapD